MFRGRDNETLRVYVKKFEVFLGCRIFTAALTLSYNLPPPLLHPERLYTSKKTCQKFTKKCKINRDVIVNCQNRTSLYEVTNFRVNKNCDRHYPHVIMKPYFLEARGRSRQSAPPRLGNRGVNCRYKHSTLVFPICPLV